MLMHNPLLCSLRSILKLIMIVYTDVSVRILKYTLTSMVIYSHIEI